MFDVQSRSWLILCVFEWASEGGRRGENERHGKTEKLSIYRISISAHKTISIYPNQANKANESWVLVKRVRRRWRMMKKFSTRFTKQSIHIFDTGVLSDDLFAELIQRDADDDDGGKKRQQQQQRWMKMGVRMWIHLGGLFAVCVRNHNEWLSLSVSFASAFNGNIAPLLPSFPLIFFLPPWKSTSISWVNMSKGFSVDSLTKHSITTVHSLKCLLFTSSSTIATWLLSCWKEHNIQKWKASLCGFEILRFSFWCNYALSAFLWPKNKRRREHSHLHT